MEQLVYIQAKFTKEDIIAALKWNLSHLDGLLKKEGLDIDFEEVADDLIDYITD